MCWVGLQKHPEEPRISSCETFSLGNLTHGEFCLILLGVLLSRVSMANYKTDRNISCLLELSHTLILSVKFKGAQAGSVGFKLDRPR